MITTPRVILRRSNMVDMIIKSNPSVSMYRFRGHNTLNDAFTSSVPMFEVTSGNHYRSTSLVKKKIGFVEDIKRGTTRVTIDPNDFANKFLPMGTSTLYLRVEEYNSTLGGYNPPGPVIVIPHEDLWSRANSTFVLYGSAPVTGSTPGVNPTSDTMCVCMTQYMSSIFLRNLSTANGLLYSFSEYGPMAPLPSGEEMAHTEGSGNGMVFLSSADPLGLSSVDFSIVFACRAAL